MIEDYRFFRVRRPKADKLTRAEIARASKLLGTVGLTEYSFKQRAHYLILDQATGDVVAGPLDTAAMRKYVSPTGRWGSQHHAQPQMTSSRPSPNVSASGLRWIGRGPFSSSCMVKTGTMSLAVRQTR